VSATRIRHVHQLVADYARAVVSMRTSSGWKSNFATADRVPRHPGGGDSLALHLATTDSERQRVGQHGGYGHFGIRLPDRSPEGSMQSWRGCRRQEVGFSSVVSTPRAFTTPMWRTSTVTPSSFENARRYAPRLAEPSIPAMCRNRTRTTARNSARRPWLAAPNRHLRARQSRRLRTSSRPHVVTAQPSIWCVASCSMFGHSVHRVGVRGSGRPEQ
jgi:hypothetical protein